MNTLEEWTAAVVAELGLAAALPELDLESRQTRDLVLDLARDAAHDVARPAAPLTTFLVGLAAGRSGGKDLAAMVSRVTEMAAARADSGEKKD